MRSLSRVERDYSLVLLAGLTVSEMPKGKMYGYDLASISIYSSISVISPCQGLFSLSTPGILLPLVPFSTSPLLPLPRSPSNLSCSCYNKQ